MTECLPTLRRLGDQRCTGRALHLLGERAPYEQRDLAGAEDDAGSEASNRPIARAA